MIEQCLTRQKPLENRKNLFCPQLEEILNKIQGQRLKDQLQKTLTNEKKEEIRDKIIFLCGGDAIGEIVNTYPEIEFIQMKRKKRF